MTGLQVADVGPRDASVVVVWLGSLGSTMRVWDRQLSALHPMCRNVLIDLPGHGGSRDAPAPSSMSGLADAIVAELDRLGVSRCHVVGLSIGAMIAMQMAIADPARVGRLALLCTSAQLGPSSAWHDRAAAVRAQGASAIAETVVGRWLTPAYAERHPDEVAELVGMVASSEPEGYAACCEAIAAMDLRADLPSIGAPTLVVAGSQDPATSPEHAELIASLIPGARVEVVDAAHLASWEQPAAVNALLRDHLFGGEGGG